MVILAAGATQAAGATNKMALTKAQLRNARIIINEGRKRTKGLPPSAARKVILSGLATGLVESNLENLNYGDRDSLGVFQQRSSWGSPSQRQNVRYAANKYLDQAVPNANKFSHVGELAQSVQRSAYPGKYQQRVNDAKAILRDIMGSEGVERVKGFTTVTVKGKPETVDKHSALVDSLLAGGTGTPGSVLGRAKHNVDSGNYTTAAIPDSTERVAKYEKLARPKETVSVGRVHYDPAGMANGKKPAKQLTSFLKVAAGYHGEPLNVGTTTNHNVMTSSGNLSDHPSGNAADIPATGRTGDRIATSVFRAAGWSAAKARAAARKGGVYNIQLPNGQRLQVLWKTRVGGNHYDHVHVGLK